MDQVYIIYQSNSIHRSIFQETNQLNNRENLIIEMIDAYVKKLKDIQDNVVMKLFYLINSSQYILI